MHNRPSDITFLDLALRVSFTQAMVVIALVAAAHHYQLPFGQNLSGLLLGYASYVTVNIASYAAAVEFGKTLFSGILWFLSPIAYVLCLVIWTRAMWDYQPKGAASFVDAGSAGTSNSHRQELSRLNSLLLRVLRR
jgi:hypothetical protein